MSDVHPHITKLRDLETKTLERVAHEGRAEICAGGCRMIGRECPGEWCEAIYQRLRREVSP